MSKNPQHISISLKKVNMLAALKSTNGAVTRAAELAQITPQTHYNWYRNDEEYRNNVDNIKYETFEAYKDIVIAAVFKKISEGNATVINKCFQTMFAKWAEQMERANPYRPRMIPKIKYIDKRDDAKL